MSTLVVKVALGPAKVTPQAPLPPTAGTILLPAAVKMVEILAPVFAVVPVGAMVGAVAAMAEVAAVVAVAAVQRKPGTASTGLEVAAMAAVATIQARMVATEMRGLATVAPATLVGGHVRLCQHCHAADGRLTVIKSTPRFKLTTKCFRPPVSLSTFFNGSKIEQT